MKNRDEKTNVLRVLDARKIIYSSHAYNPDSSLTGSDIAKILGEEPACVFKTLVTQGKSGNYYVFVVPVNQELDLKKAAKASNEKFIAMIKQRDLLSLTGYVHGGCSPIGMKKQFPTFIHESAMNYEKIFVSAGRVGLQVEINPQDLIGVIKCAVCDIAS